MRRLGGSESVRGKKASRDRLIRRKSKRNKASKMEGEKKKKKKQQPRRGEERDIVFSLSEAGFSGPVSSGET